MIGQKGKNVQGITSMYNVQIKFPDRGNQKEKENGGKLVTCLNLASKFGVPLQELQFKFVLINPVIIQ